LRIRYFVFDLLIWQDRDLTVSPLSERRRLMKSAPQSRSARIRIAEWFGVSARGMLAAVRQQQLEGVIERCKNSLKDAGKRTGQGSNARRIADRSWSSAGIPGLDGFDSLMVGYYRGKDSTYGARVRNGFVPTLRRQGVCRRQYGTRSISGDRLLGLRKYACHYIVMERKSLHSLDDPSRNS